MKSIYQIWKSKVTGDYIREYIDEDGDLVREDENKEFHSLYSPALECSDGTKHWLYHGKLHRLDGPAIEYSSGNKTWYINNKLIGKSEDGFTPEDFKQYKINNNIVT
jgi:hypothetical protein